MAVVSFPSPSSPSPTAGIRLDGGKVITPSDADTFERPVAVFVGTGGTVTCTPANLTADVQVTVPSGGFVPFRVLAVKATGTAATGLVAVY